jgi:hypothetical protein
MDARRDQFVKGTESLLRLRHYAPVEPAYRTPILFVYALTKRAFILDLAPGRSVLQSLAQQGFHVYPADRQPAGPYKRVLGSALGRLRTDERYALRMDVAHLRGSRRSDRNRVQIGLRPFAAANMNLHAGLQGPISSKRW